MLSNVTPLAYTIEVFGLSDGYELTSVSSSASTTTYTAFGAFGDILGSKQTTANVDYNFSYSYNLAHTLISIGYPNSGGVVTFGYDLANRVNSATGAVNGGTPTPYAEVPSGGFAPHGAIQTLNLNNAQLVETTRFNALAAPVHHRNVGQRDAPRPDLQLLLRQFRRERPDHVLDQQRQCLAPADRFRCPELRAVLRGNAKLFL